MSTSTAILLAGALIGLGLFLGLRSLAPGGLAAAPGGPPPAAPPAPASPPPQPPALDLATAQRHAANALAYHRDALRQDCYLPAVAGEATPPTVLLEFNYTFDAEGLQIARGAVETRGASRPEVTQCVLAKLPPLRIPRPGQLVTATLPLSFP
ncbi:hypothetical protein [Nannocystis punicea]|uniref:AgmX/PglI C-terminal domain-containing protein n=1 Tax=Nannocystis punicea TaxID=2995304 RepID=A0ABY7HC54_9BACT|nr:hypothetical protein [Nannocystis poenicansa]WAS96680.1 hypothetical protein O0S08_11060 [Nannocystis poenicansa]